MGIVTAVAAAHTARLGGIEGVARAKAELVEALPAHGLAILNADDERVRSMRRLTAAPVLTFGEAAEADVGVEDIALDELARPSFRVRTPWGSANVRLRASGRHLIHNAAAAVAAAGALDVDVNAAARRVSEARLSASRMAVHQLPSGAVIIDDAYNANPTSMAAALDALMAIPARRRVAVIGVMAELDDAAAAHRSVTVRAFEQGIELIVVGTDLYGVAPSVDPIAAVGQLATGTAVLVKASRIAGLDRVAAELVRASSPVEPLDDEPLP
jgi:UDP-N-acetylmuramoyl-tripeptide--D-alanyl-D-alanine ligase